MRKLLIAIALVAMPLYAVEPEDLEFATATSLPPAVWAALRTHREQLSPYALSAHLNPFYLQGDFSGDGYTDTFILVKERVSGKIGVLVVDGTGAEATVLGAGRPFGNGGDDFSWMDAWHVHPRGLVHQGADEVSPPLLKGDALMVVKTGSASALIYWTGVAYEWYQQGD